MHEFYKSTYREGVRFILNRKNTRQPVQNTNKKGYEVTELARMFFVYILTNINRTVLYTGVTNNLQMRVAEHYHKRNETSSFAGKYSCFNLIYYEELASIKEAIAREKVIKNRSRAWKERLIAKVNPDWKFYNEALFDPWPPDENYCR